MPSPSPSAFFRLPRELRDTIYHLYVFEPEGYHFHLASGKLRASGNRPINLALMRTCTTVAAEMRHLPLRSNVLHFSTSADPSESERTISARFDMLLSYMQLGRFKTLDSLGWLPLRRYQTPDVNAKLALKYPVCPVAPLVSRAVGKPSLLWESPCWGEADSEFLAFQSYMIELLSTDTDFLEALADFYKTRYTKMLDDPKGSLYLPVVDEDSRAQREELLRYLVEKEQKTRRERALFFRSVLSASSPEPWIIPSQKELAQMNANVNLSSSNPAWEAQRCLGLEEPRQVEGNPWKRVKWRFSAAAAAIHFFKSISQDTCSGVRKVVLHEDRPSVARPESHVLGVIPFCVQNPQLHVERRVNMWRVLLSPHQRKATCLHDTAEEIRTISGVVRTRDSVIHDGGRTVLIGQSCCRWITEASVLSAKGMPAHSFSLVLDGDPAPDQSSVLFQRVKEDAAWQVAQAQWYSDQSLSPGFIATRSGGFYMSEVFPQAISDIVNGKSFISCNFPTGNLHDPRRVLDMNRHINHDPTRDVQGMIPGREWISASTTQHYRNRIQVSPPLLSLAGLVVEDFMPEEQPDAA
ncbi:MAG: hypothetical protein Q9199_001576 [Rusavskia elegans]